jgi:hypothetical protein
MADNLMDGLLSEMNRVREIVKEYNAQPKNAGRLATLFMQLAIEKADESIKVNNVVKMLQCYSKLKEYEL